MLNLSSDSLCIVYDFCLADGLYGIEAEGEFRKGSWALNGRQYDMDSAGQQRRSF